KGMINLRGEVDLKPAKPSGIFGGKLCNLGRGSNFDPRSLFFGLQRDAQTGMSGLRSDGRDTDITVCFFHKPEQDSQTGMSGLRLSKMPRQECLGYE
ncbi:MAG: hypothetical protein ABI162_17325, partial [Luteolibacter sp.]